MIYTVTMNPALDYTIRMNTLHQGIVNRADSTALSAGGKGINVSRVLKNIGMDSVCMGFTAGFTGRELEKQLSDEGIKTEFIHTEHGETRINVKLKAASETDINAPGPKINAQDINRLAHRLKSAESGDYVFLCGSVPPGAGKECYAEIMRSAKGLKYIVDTSGKPLYEAVREKPFLIKPNNFELSEFFGKEITDRDETVFYAKKMQELGAENVLVSLGADGAVLCADNGRVYICEAPRGDVSDCVGAGDSMAAGFMYGYIKYADFKKALEIGICAGSATAFKEGLADKQTICGLLKKVSAKRIC